MVFMLSLYFLYIIIGSVAHDLFVVLHKVLIVKESILLRLICVCRVINHPPIKISHENIKYLPRWLLLDIVERRLARDIVLVMSELGLLVMERRQLMLLLHWQLLRDHSA